MTMRVAFLGLGDLGGLMCDHVIAAGHDVAVFDPSTPAVRPRAALGARVATSPADAASRAEVVCVVVRDDTQALAAITGPDGVLDGIQRDAIVVLHSTVAPETVRRLHRRCVEDGVRFIDVAIGAGAGRETGEMFAMCGGEQTTIDAVRPVLECFAQHIVRFGEVGAGMAAKLARNMIQYGMWCVIDEGMALAEAAGLDLPAFAHLIRNSGVSTSQEVVLNRTTAKPSDPIPGSAGAERFERVVTLAWKDLGDAFELAHEVGVQTPIARLTRRGLGPAVGIALLPAD